MAKAATIVPVRALNCQGSGYNSDVIAGLEWVVSHHQAGTPAVANRSLGSTASAMVDAAAQAVISDGVSVAVAAGKCRRRCLQPFPGPGNGRLDRRCERLGGPLG